MRIRSLMTILEKYVKKRLEINMSKTKIMECRKGEGGGK